MNVFLLREDGSEVRGGFELLEEWKASSNSHIWVDMYRLSEDDENRIAAVFGLHHLVMTDARRQSHPPKLEVFDDHLFILLKGLDAESRGLDFGSLQLAMFAGERFLVTRHDKRSVSLEGWSESPRLAEVLKQSGIMLALGMSTSVARRYIDLLAEFEPSMEALEDQLQEKPSDATMRELTLYRTRLRKMRRDFNYHCRIFEALREEQAVFFHGRKGRYKHVLTDTYEKYERLLSLCTMYYEQAGDLVDGYLSLSSHELNNTMRLLTLLTAIFVPLGFLAGLYGMNFDYMPELHYRWGYFVLLGVMGTLIVTLLVVFRRMRWL
ncbi:magnesium transporter CorA family protein [Halomonas binhaiensis]|uniref:Magnesium transporter CorA family protein n=1 Tax=Halomonas binhaiensis TaxID=2562282 RepID=A0A5C1NDN8_9GAMM|nr:magnesium transporter CorA family protein [Halomonas binhaiensis]QEM80783.1 magnesium transporter CorA family protein [Halomonas binhaiensis]